MRDMVVSVDVADDTSVRMAVESLCDAGELPRGFELSDNLVDKCLSRLEDESLMLNDDFDGFVWSFVQHELKEIILEEVASDCM